MRISFRDKINRKPEEIVESPVGQVGRTKDIEAEEHIGPELIKRFQKIVKELGGKAVAKQLLNKMNRPRLEESTESVEEFIRDLGYKIKKSTPTFNGTKLDLFKSEEADDVFLELEKANFKNIFLDGKSIIYK